MSNTWNLWHNKNWNALLIEADKKKYDVLVENVKSFQKVIPENCYVDSTGKNSLESIMSEYSLTDNPDLLSIDIDGNDYHIFKNLTKCHPRVIVIEINPTIPPHIDIYQDDNQSVGSSALAMKKLGEEKGYKLAAMTQFNCIFVKNEEFPKLKIHERRLEELFNYGSITYLMSTFNGLLFINQKPGFYTMPNNIFSLTHFKMILRKYLKGINIPKSISERFNLIKIFKI